MTSLRKKYHQYLELHKLLEHQVYNYFEEKRKDIWAMALTKFHPKKGQESALCLQDPTVNISWVNRKRTTIQPEVTIKELRKNVKV